MQRGDKLIWCAGALAEAYEKIGGKVIYYGKPHPPIYDASPAHAATLAGRDIRRPLAIGDGADTDIKGANGGASMRCSWRRASMRRIWANSRPKGLRSCSWCRRRIRWRPCAALVW